MNDSFLTYLNNFSNKVLIEEIIKFDIDDIIQTFDTLDKIDSEFLLTLENDNLDNEFLSLLEAKGGGGGRGRMRQKIPTSREKIKAKAQQQDKGKYSIANQPGNYKKLTLVKGEKKLFQREQWRSTDEPEFAKSLQKSMKKDLAGAKEKGADGTDISKKSSSLLDTIKTIKSKLDGNPEVKDSITKQLETYRTNGLNDVEQGKGNDWLDASEKAMVMLGGDLKKYYSGKELEKRYDALASTSSGKVEALHTEIINRTLDRHNIPRDYLADPKGWEQKNGKLENVMKVPSEVYKSPSQQGTQTTKTGKEPQAAQTGQSTQATPKQGDKRNWTDFESFVKQMATEFNSKNPQNPVDVDSIVSGIVNQTKHREGYKTKQDLQATIDKQHNDIVAAKDQTIKVQQNMINNLLPKKTVIGQEAPPKATEEIVQKTIETASIAAAQRKAAKLAFTIKGKRVRSSEEKRRKWKGWGEDIENDAKAFVDGTIDPKRVETVSIPGNGENIFHEVSYLKRRDGEEGIRFNGNMQHMKFERVNKKGEVIDDNAPGGERMLPIKLTVNVGTNDARTLTASTNGRMGEDRGLILFKQGHVLNEEGNPINKAHIASLTGWKAENDKEAGRYYHQKKQEQKVTMEEARVAVRGQDGSIIAHKPILLKVQTGGNIPHNKGFQPSGGADHAQRALGLNKTGANFFGRLGKSLLHGDMENGIGMYLDHTGQIAPETMLSPGQSMPIDPVMKKRMEGSVVDAMNVADKSIRAVQGLGLRFSKEWAGLSSKEMLRRWDEFKKSGGHGSEKASHLNLVRKMVGHAAALRYMIEQGTARNVDEVVMELKGGKSENPAKNLIDLGARMIKSDPKFAKALGGRLKEAQEGGPLKILRDKMKAAQNAAEGVVRKQRERNKIKQTAEKAPEFNATPVVTDNTKVSPEEHEDFVNTLNEGFKNERGLSFLGSMLQTLKHKFGKTTSDRVKGYLDKVGALATKMGGPKAEALAKKMISDVASTQPNNSGGVNGSFITNFKSGGQAISKPQESAVINLQKDYTLGTQHEAIAYAASERFKTLPSAQAKGITEGTVPVTAHANGQSSQERIVPGSTVQNKEVVRVQDGEDVDWKNSVAQEEINSAASFDFVIGQADRRSRNMLVAETSDRSHHLVSIDNGMTFPSSRNAEGMHHLWASPEEGNWGEESFVSAAKGTISQADKDHIASTFSDDFINSLPVRNTVKNGMKYRRDHLVASRDFKSMGKFYNTMRRQSRGEDAFEA
jgi:hypothetical protein